MYGQETFDASIAIIVNEPHAVPFSISDLRVEVKGQPAILTSITPLKGNCLQYILINDSSGGTYWPNGTKEQADAADEFLKQIITSSDIGTLINFNDQAYADIQNTNDPKKLSAKIDRNGRGGTLLYDTVIMAADYSRQQTLAAGCRTVLFLFSDGGDNASKHKLADASEALERAYTPLFIIAPSSVQTKKQGDVLRKMAEKSGGRVYFFDKNEKQWNFDLLRRDLGQSFLLNIHGTLPNPKQIAPLSITDISGSKLHIIAPTQIVMQH